MGRPGRRTGGGRAGRRPFRLRADDGRGAARRPGGVPGSMTVLDARPALPAAPALALVATRRLAVLDELRVPYRHPADAGGRWASLSAGDPARALYWFTGRAA